VVIPFTSRIIETAVTVTTKAGSFKDCLHVREIGKVAITKQAVCSDNKGLIATVNIAHDRWWAPKYGNIKSDEVESYFTAHDSKVPCEVYRYYNELVEKQGN
jgi:hypothetical protein